MGEGRDAQEGVERYNTGSLCCTAETNTLQSNYPPIKKNFKAFTL